MGRRIKPELTRITFLVALGALLGSVPAPGVVAARSETMTVRLLSATTEMRLVTDRAPLNRPSVGDTFSEKSVLRNAVAQFGRRKGAVVGRDAATLTMVSAKTVAVKVTARLPGGTISSGARVNLRARGIALNVVGGTGAFAGATGRVDVRRLDASGTVTTNVYTLRLP